MTDICETAITSIFKGDFMTNKPIDHAAIIKEKLQELTMHMPAAGYIRQAGLIPHILPFSSASLWRFVNNGTFPAPYKLSPRITAWRISDVMDWASKVNKIRTHKRKFNTQVGAKGFKTSDADAIQGLKPAVGNYHPSATALSAQDHWSISQNH